MDQPRPWSLQALIQAGRVTDPSHLTSFEEITCKGSSAFDRQREHRTGSHPDVPATEGELNVQGSPIVIAATASASAVGGAFCLWLFFFPFRACNYLLNASPVFK